MKAGENMMNEGKSAAAGRSMRNGRKHLQQENKMFTLVFEKFFWIVRLHGRQIKQICGEDKNKLRLL
jgi:hypothetical protein